MTTATKFVLTVLALCAFAGNSVLCRWALAEFAMNPAQFTVIRLGSGALTLALIILYTVRKQSAGEAKQVKPSWWGAVWLALYAYAFAYAYIGLATGVGALILFTAVQLSMLCIGAWRGARYGRVEMLGIGIALSGFSYLVWPQLSAPLTTFAVLLMSLAGTAWGAYSIVGRGSRAPLRDTMTHFTRASLISLPLLLIVTISSAWQAPAVGLALMSGVVTSALGYTLWFKVLPQLRVSSAAVGQLAVPLIAAWGGVIFVGESLTFRFLLASGLTLGGIALVTRYGLVRATKKSHANKL